MFSFRTTPIQDQLDKALMDGRVACFCTQNCWDAASGSYLYDIFRERGNLALVLNPRDTELCPETNHIEFDESQLEGVSAVVIEIQDAGSRYFNYTRDVLQLLSWRARSFEGPAIYVVDHLNPAGRAVEGTIPVVGAGPWVPKVAHRHGLTLGELCHLYYEEIDAKFPLHIISAFASSPSLRTSSPTLRTSTAISLMPWVIAPASDIPGLFTCSMYSGGALWNNTNLTPGIGTARPYEYIGAPFIKTNSVADMPCPRGALMRPCSFTPSAGKYAGEKCFGFQIILEGGIEYHSLLHTISLMRYLVEHYSQFEMSPELFVKIADPVIEEYLKERIPFDVVQEHVKVEEQKWIRKAKRFLLYDDAPYRLK